MVFHLSQFWSQTEASRVDHQLQQAGRAALLAGLSTSPLDFRLESFFVKDPELSTSQLSLYFKEPSTLKITYVLSFTWSDIFNEPCRMSCSAREWSQCCQGRPGKQYCHNLFDNSEKKDFSQNYSNSVSFFSSFFHLLTINGSQPIANSKLVVLLYRWIDNAVKLV